MVDSSRPLKFVTIGKLKNFFSICNSKGDGAVGKT